jgi:hypothetical protein
MKANYYGLTNTDLKSTPEKWKELIDNIITLLSPEEVEWLFFWDMTEKASNLLSDSEMSIARYFHYMGYFDRADKDKK